MKYMGGLKMRVQKSVGMLPAHARGSGGVLRQKKPQRGRKPTLSYVLEMSYDLPLDPPVLPRSPNHYRQWRSVVARSSRSWLCFFGFLHHCFATGMPRRTTRLAEGDRGPDLRAFASADSERQVPGEQVSDLVS